MNWKSYFFSVFLFFVFLSPRRIRDLLIFFPSLCCFLYIFVFARVQVAKVTSVESQDQRKLRILFLCFFFSESTTRVLCWDFREAVTISAGNFRSSLVCTAYFLSSGATSLHSTFLFDTRVVLSTGFLINPLSLGLATSVQPLSSSHWIIFKHTSSTKHTSHAVEDGW